MAHTKEFFSINETNLLLKRFNMENKMITLRDIIEIKTSPEKVFDFFIHFKENFMAWHPDHVRCWYFEDGPLKEGSAFCVQEYLHKKIVTLEFHVTRLVPYSRIEYKIPPIVKGDFIIEERGSNVLFHLLTFNNKKDYM